MSHNGHQLFGIGYHFNKFDSQVATEKKVNFTPCNKIKIDMVESKEAFNRVFEFSVQEMSKLLLQNGIHIVLKPEQEAAIRV